MDLQGNSARRSAVDSNREQTAGQWVDRNKMLLGAENDNTFRLRDTSVY